jgi:hypothetical protein
VTAIWTAEHVARLEEVFPDRCPDPGTDHRKQDRLAGNVEVVRFIRSELEHQQTHNMEGGLI